MQSVTAIEVLVIGGGPAGQKAAIQAVKAGKKVALVEQDRTVGGGCVSRGTIPSKSLREAALRAIEVEKSSTLFASEKRTGVELADLMSSVESIVDAHAAYMGRQLERNGVRLVHGRARFVSPREVVVRSPTGSAQRFNAELIVIATGSRPRSPPDVPVDHDHILDSDSILSMHALPESLCVLGGGVIACEYASIFANLGVKVTLIDKAERPLAFMDPELVKKLAGALERCGGRVIGGQPVPKVEFDGVSHVVAKLASGEEIRAERMLV
ncbi:MAG: FAD-dependent oxidoreductase, partial [Deltaproteobacteria bacterium]|nr:FAD-dependent oxidoreductase [Deltaproteobacteria bacterium]